MANFIIGDVPSDYDHLIVRDPFALQGKWKEMDKPFQACADILARLGFMAIKRKIVARCHSDMDLFIITKPGGTFSDSTPVEPVARTEDPETSTGRPSPSTAATTPNPSVPPSQPLSPLGHRSEGEKSSSESAAAHTWQQRQYFPMGREKSAEFVSDGVSQFEIDDPDTGHWVISVLYKDGRLIQKRYSESLGLTMYDTRCVLREKVKLSQEMEICEEDGREVWQLFQWKIIDHKKNDEAMLCYYYLKKLQP
eukprot:Gregarina_sp_Pseudo_9__1811@NODE_2230_length_1085_cov_145_629063_g2054_i0_p1_GENE_NODE_2230_length_1085_cov_145_629063_g2054_i0NODE_2230_length_1085_cov_145_629063_g2054_i0_p1_ORF_typecomplete_len271_score1_78DUF2141/PF09912_9/8_2DUF2141/PF09912_9/1_1e02_NODE_2230_length_1085_cov_145_629063_g2054_i060815